LVGVVGTDAVSLTGTGVGSFADKRVGSGKTVTMSGYSLSGDEADQYVLGAMSGVASITAKSVTVSGYDLVVKDYDGTRAAELTGTSELEGVIDGVLEGVLEGVIEGVIVGIGFETISPVP
jgi:hypothetical protein